MYSWCDGDLEKLLDLQLVLLHELQDAAQVGGALL